MTISRHRERQAPAVLVWVADGNIRTPVLALNSGLGMDQHHGRWARVQHLGWLSRAEMTAKGPEPVCAVPRSTARAPTRRNGRPPLPTLENAAPMPNWGIQPRFPQSALGAKAALMRSWPRAPNRRARVLPPRQRWQRTAQGGAC